MSDEIQPDEVPDEQAPGERRPAGPDLVRTALAAAKAEARRRGAAPRRTTGGSGEGRGRRRPVAASASGAHPDDRDPQPLAATVRRLLEERGWEPTVQVAGVMGRWEQLVGDELAGHCRPERFEDGELTLVAESTAWATQLRLLAPTLVRRLNEQLGDRLVRRVRVHGPTAPDWRKGGWRVAGGRGPRDTYG